MIIAFPITGVILTNILGLNIMVSYQENRISQVKKYNEYLFFIIFFNCLSWMLYGIVTNDHLIYLSCVLSLFFDFGFIQILYKHIDQTQLLKLELLSGAFLLYFIIIIYLLNFTQINKTKILLPIIGNVSMFLSIFTNFSPFIIIKKVIITKSNKLIYLPQALIGCLNLSCWLAYGFILNDNYQIITNGFGLSMCIIQVFIYWFYSKEPENTNKIIPENQIENQEQYL